MREKPEQLYTIEQACIQYPLPLTVPEVAALVSSGECVYSTITLYTIVRFGKGDAEGLAYPTYAGAYNPLKRL